MRILNKISETISFLLRKLIALVELILFVRLSLKFLGANPQALIVNFIYWGSDFLINPFNFIFQDIYWKEKYLIEAATLSAIIGYGILSYLIFQLFRLFTKS